MYKYITLQKKFFLLRLLLTRYQNTSPLFATDYFVAILIDYGAKY